MSINAATIIGFMFGSLFSGSLIKSGRRRSAFLANSLNIVGCLPQLIINFWTILIGKFLVGLASGMIIVVCSVYMRETVPAS